MLFNSLQFFLFFIIVTTLYFGLPHKYRWLMLLLASCWFYMAFIPVYILILFFTIIVDYSAGIFIEKANDVYKKIFLIISLIANIGVLAFFKYYNFFTYNLDQITSFFNYNHTFSYLNIILPIGLSFHTFQAMSYTIEVYRGNQKAERHLGIYALYVMYYPQLVAGPIERPQHILHQLHQEKKWDSARFKSGMQLILWGLFKKVVVADRLALFVDNVYKYPLHQSTLNVTIAVVFYSFQIYYDFSGYSTIARGLSRIMGIELMENFRIPYFSKSLAEFWTRWHISLSTWFRDYLYIPLGGNRVRPLRKCINILIVFTISGLWHGASWGFIIWGTLHGSAIVVNDLKNKFSSLKTKLPKVLNGLFVFSFVSFAWIFFRSPSTATTKVILNKLFQNDWVLRGFDFREIIYCLLLIIFICIKEYNDSKLKEVNTGRFYLKFTIGLFIIYFLGIFSENQFIYFQF
jgi:alginate O-acetyltransferase complex protein AlgI